VPRLALGSSQLPVEYVLSLWVKLTNHLHRVLSLRMGGAIPLLPPVSSWHAQVCYFTAVRHCMTYRMTYVTLIVCSSVWLPSINVDTVVTYPFGAGIFF
jgi:hypothetical protein